MLQHNQMSSATLSDIICVPSEMNSNQLMIEMILSTLGHSYGFVGEYEIIATDGSLRYTYKGNQDGATMTVKVISLKAPSNKLTIQSITPCMKTDCSRIKQFESLVTIEHEM